MQITLFAVTLSSLLSAIATTAPAAAALNDNVSLL